jgi:hypothetical protein
MSTHFRMTELLDNPARVVAALQDGAVLRLVLAEAAETQRQLTGAIWSTETIRMTADIADLLATGRPAVLPVAALATFAATLVFNGASTPVGAMQGAHGMRVMLAVATLVGFAHDHLDASASATTALLVANDGAALTLCLAQDTRVMASGLY